MRHSRAHEALSTCYNSSLDSQNIPGQMCILFTGNGDNVCFWERAPGFLLGSGRDWKANDGTPVQWAGQAAVMTWVVSESPRHLAVHAHQQSILKWKTSYFFGCVRVLVQSKVLQDTVMVNKAFLNPRIVGLEEALHSGKGKKKKRTFSLG